MSDRLSDLLAEAQNETNCRRNDWAKYSAIAATLRNKGWSYRRIFEWLTARGEPLAEEHFSRFRVAISTRASRKKKGKPWVPPTEMPPTEMPAPTELPDAELDRICSSRGAEVNHFLRSRGHIGREQSYRSMPAAFRARVLKNPAAFLKAARGEGRAE